MATVVLADHLVDVFALTLADPHTFESDHDVGVKGEHTSNAHLCAVLCDGVRHEVPTAAVMQLSAAVIEDDTLAVVQLRARDLVVAGGLREGDDEHEGLLGSERLTRDAFGVVGGQTVLKH